MEKRALGKGLSALIPEKAAQEVERAASSVAQVPTSQIKDNTLQPRKNYDPNKIAELQGSIKEKGVLQPILVRETSDGYEVVAGERRLRAARANQLPEVPVVIRNVSDEEALVLALVENIQREELNAIEEAQAFERLMESFGMSQDEIALSVGKDRSTISNTLRLLRLPDDIQQAVVDGKISMGHARTLLSIEEPVKRREIFLAIIEKGLSVREVESLARMQPQALRRAKRVKPKTENPDLVFLEEDLQRHLGTKVRIQAQKKRGKVLIEYYSNEDLDRIVKLIKTSSS